MTFIQPNKKSFLNKILIALIVILVLGAVWLVVIYNNFVNFTHGFSQMKAELQTIQAKNVETREKIFGLVDSANVQGVALEKNLVQDKKPAYLELVRN